MVKEYTIFSQKSRFNYSSFTRQFISKETEYLLGIFHFENLKHKN